jgi:hypothetical protein
MTPTQEFGVERPGFGPLAHVIIHIGDGSPYLRERKKIIDNPSTFNG